MYTGVILIAPINRVYNGPFESDSWSTQYVLNTLHYSVLIIPVILLFILLQKFEVAKVNKIMSVILYFLSGFISFIALKSLSLPMQDFVPKWGMAFLLILFPVVLINSFVEKSSME